MAERNAEALVKEAVEHPRDQWVTHDVMNAALELAFPGSTPGVDYRVAMLVAPNSAEQWSNAFLADWKLSVPEPSQSELMTILAPVLDKARENVLCRDMRHERDVRLDASDVLLTRAMEDGDNDKLAKLRAYRTALRDVPNQEGFPHEITWPAMPQ